MGKLYVLRCCWCWACRWAFSQAVRTWADAVSSEYCIALDCKLCCCCCWNCIALRGVAVFNATEGLALYIILYIYWMLLLPHSSISKAISDVQISRYPPSFLLSLFSYFIICCDYFWIFLTPRVTRLSRSTRSLLIHPLAKPRSSFLSTICPSLLPKNCPPSPKYARGSPVPLRAPSIPNRRIALELVVPASYVLLIPDRSSHREPRHCVLLHHSECDEVRVCALHYASCRIYIVYIFFVFAIRTDTLGPRLSSPSHLSLISPFSLFLIPIPVPFPIL